MAILTTVLLSAKGSSDPSHFIFEINVRKRRIQHRTTLNSNGFNRFWVDLEIHHSISDLILCRIRLSVRLVSKIKWLGYGVPATKLCMCRFSKKWELTFKNGHRNRVFYEFAYLGKLLTGYGSDVIDHYWKKAIIFRDMRSRRCLQVKNDARRARKKLKCYLCVILCGGGSFGNFTIGVQCILVIEEK